MLKKSLAVIGAALILFSGTYWLYREYYGPQNSALIQATGTIEATQVDLSVKTYGVIESLTIQEGDTLSEGQLVARLSRPDLVAQQERDAMSLLKAEAQLADLTSGAREQEIIEAQANVEIARANWDNSLTELARKEALFQADVIAQEELERFQLNTELNKNRLQAAEARLSLLQSGQRPQLIKAARAEVERSRAILKTTEALLRDLQVYAPLSGVVLTKNYQVGEYLPLGASIATIADLENLWIKVYIPTDALPSIKLGQKAHFSVSGWPDVFEGVVCEIASKGEFTPKTIQTKEERTNVVFGVKLRVNSEGGRLKPGMPADVTFERE